MPRLGFRLSLARRTRPVPNPTILSLPDLAIAKQASSLISFNRLEAPPVYSEETLVSRRTLLGARMLETRIANDTALTSNDLDMEAPQFETLFAPMERPRLAGRVYTEGADSSELDDASKPRHARGASEIAALQTRCRHGIAKASCSICRGEARQPRPREPATVDVFQLLWFVLQPPILSRIGRADLFPDGRKPYPFQVEGVKWLIERPQALLADEMGLGKTIQAIIAMRILFRRGKLQQVLVVCPVSVTETWMRELKNWAPELRAMYIRGTVDERGARWVTASEVKIVSYASLRSDIQSGAAPTTAFDLCLLDEAQNIKNSEIGQSKAVRQITARYRWALTGTPMENRLDDVRSIFQFLLGQNYRQSDVADVTATPARVRHAINSYTLRRTIVDVQLDLPPIKQQEVWLELTDEQKHAYERAEQTGVSKLRQRGEAVSRIHIFALIASLKLICNRDDTTGKNSKLEFLESQLDELTSNGEKALVFSQYPDRTLKRIKPTLTRFSPLLFDGSLSAKARTEIVRDFQESEENKVLLMGVKSGGMGITLHRANHVFHFDHWWTPAAEEQATARVYRIGQERPVLVKSLFTLGTIEERIAQLLKEKRRLFGEVFDKIGEDEIGEDERLLERLSDADIFGLFGLPAPPRGRMGTVLPETDHP